MRNKLIDKNTGSGKIKSKYFFALCFISILVNTTPLISQDSFVKLDKRSYNQGDTITLSCNYPIYKSDSLHFATWYLLIQKVGTNQFWRFRYPLVDGLGSAEIVIDSFIKPGKYAFKFMLRKQFFVAKATVLNELPDLAEINYTLITKNNSSFSNNVKPDQNGNFSIRGILFEDSATLILSPVNKTKYPDKLDVIAYTPLDSTFISDTTCSVSITVGKVDSISVKEPGLSVNEEFKAIDATLPGVTVNTVAKKKIDLFDEEYSTGMFRNKLARIFDGIEDNTISQSQNIFVFLQGRIAGLRVIPTGRGYVLQWGGTPRFRQLSNVDVYLDEIRSDIGSTVMITPSDVAMIKAYPPPAFLSAGGQNGAIAVYTKRGMYDDRNSRSIKFRVFGYTPITTRWK